MTPEETLEYTKRLKRNMRYLQSHAVYVGLPREKVGDKVYEKGKASTKADEKIITVLKVGYWHEFGRGHNPKRSFLRVPFRIKRADLNRAIAKQIELMQNGLDPVKGMGRIGAIARNISVGAFTSKGYGTWTKLSERTTAIKGSTQILIRDGILRGSITWVIR